MKLEEQIKRIKQMMLTEAGEDPGRGGGASSFNGGTSTSSSGSFEGDAFEKGGILNNNGRKPDIGKLPKVVDITGGDSEELTLSVDDLFGIDPANDVIQTIDNLVGIPTGPGGPRGGGEGPGGPGGPGNYGDDWTGGGHGDGGGGSIDDDYGGGGDYDPDPDPDPHGPEKPTREPEKQPARGSMDFVPCCEPCGNGMWKRCNTDDCIYSTISDCELRGDNKTYNESTEPRTTFND